ncbi:hypothetical protein SOM10_11830 [Microbacterium sp. CFBP9023]|jgi:hypothetical protein|uniref:hypothetical protein n=1 Tax=Microbacterium sp. CFBP9023 TaxID=3096535 RepID=UPI0025FB9CD4|nr:hypothetical protein [Microbacterium sp. CFBP9023]MDY0984586.1 hypothetical protein [Microbacterium sp. CFBP9023]
MSDFQIKSRATGTKQDTRWRTSSHGEDAARPGQLDPSAFTSGTHYNIPGQDKNVIPSGVAVAKLANGLFGPYSATAGADDTDPRRTLAGFINDNEGVSLGDDPATAKPTFARLVHGIVNPSLLPIAAQRTTVKTAKTIISVTYVED